MQVKSNLGPFAYLTVVNYKNASTTFNKMLQDTGLNPCLLESMPLAYFHVDEGSIDRDWLDDMDWPIRWPTDEEASLMDLQLDKPATGLLVVDRMKVIEMSVNLAVDSSVNLPKARTEVLKRKLDTHLNNLLPEGL